MTGITNFRKGCNKNGRTQFAPTLSRPYARRNTLFGIQHSVGANCVRPNNSSPLSNNIIFDLRQLQPLRRRSWPQHMPVPGFKSFHQANTVRPYARRNTLFGIQHSVGANCVRPKQPITAIQQYHILLVSAPTPGAAQLAPAQACSRFQELPPVHPDQGCPGQFQSACRPGCEPCCTRKRCRIR